MGVGVSAEIVTDGLGKRGVGDVFVIVITSVNGAIEGVNCFVAVVRITGVGDICVARNSGKVDGWISWVGIISPPEQAVTMIDAKKIPTRLVNKAGFRIR
jgi:hypothetical protein